MELPRRGVLAGLAGLALAPPVQAADLPPAGPFSFLFITDTHIEPELDAAQGCAMAFARARAIGGDFALQGGDHVFDALGATRGRATALLDLYRRTEQDLGMQVHHVIGNHDCLGVYARSDDPPTDPLHGKKFFTSAFGPTFYSFDHRGVHFVVLDSVRITPDGHYEGGIDAEQIAWLKRDLDALPPGTPIVVTSHIPLRTDYDANRPLSPALARRLRVTDAAEVLAVLAGRRVLGVLQGHVHVNETLDWGGIPVHTVGAVCGDWWHGPHRGTPEGFAAVRIAEGRMTVDYQTYGFHSVAPHGR